MTRAAADGSKKRTRFVLHQGIRGGKTEIPSKPRFLLNRPSCASSQTKTSFPGSITFPKCRAFSDFQPEGTGLKNAVFPDSYARFALSMTRFSRNARPKVRKSFRVGKNPVRFQTAMEPLVREKFFSPQNSRRRPVAFRGKPT